MATMSTRLDNFSGFRIHPGHGFSYVKADAKMVHFGTYKSASAFARRSNPRKIAWTAVYRRLNKKNEAARTRKKKTRRTTRVQRAIVGASLDILKARKRNKGGPKSAQKQAALKEVRDKKKAARAGRFSRARTAGSGGRIKSSKLQRGGR